MPIGWLKSISAIASSPPCRKTGLPGAIWIRGSCGFSDLNTFDAYARRYLREWDKRANVRMQPRLPLPDRIVAGGLFPPGMQPIAKHPAVIALGEKAVLELVMRSFYKFLGEIANLEVDIVGQLCGALANGTFAFPLPAAARQVARTIGVDEYYHAYVAREQ